VALGEPVTQSQVLAVLSKESLPQSVILAEAELITAQRNLDNLLNDDVARAQAYVALVQAQDALETAENRRESKDYQRASVDTIDAARASYTLAQDEVTQMEAIFNMVKDLPETDPNRASALAALAGARQASDRALAQLNYLLSMPDELEVAIADANLLLAQANLEAAQREWDRLKDGPDPDDISAAEAQITAIQATLAMNHLEAPFNGTVTEVNSAVGDEVSPGTISFRIDDLSHLLVDVKVPEVDINRILVGQIARLSFDAIQDVEYTGQVVEVAQVGTTGQGGVDFAVTIELIDADANVRSGMTAAVNIIINQLNGVMLVPNRAIRNRDGKMVVYILQDNMPVQVVIEVGASSDTYSEVISGDLQVGDLIILNPPVDFAAGGSFMGF